jgi:hypothetical protein
VAVPCALIYRFKSPSIKGPSRLVEEWLHPFQHGRDPGCRIVQLSRIFLLAVGSQRQAKGGWPAETPSWSRERHPRQSGRVRDRPPRPSGSQRLDINSHIP